MHLISEKRIIYMLLMLTVVFFIGLMFIPITETYNVPQGTEHLKIKTEHKGSYHVS